MAMAERELKVLKYKMGKFTESIIDFFVGVYFLMLGMGGIHHDLWQSLPAVSFWHAALILFTAWQFIPVGVFKLSGINTMLEEKLGYTKEDAK